MGPVPRKSLALQEGRIMLPGVTPVLGRSDATAAASLAGPVASAVALVPLVVNEQAAVTATSREQPNAPTVVSEGVAHSVPRRPK